MEKFSAIINAHFYTDGDYFCADSDEIHFIKDEDSSYDFRYQTLIVKDSIKDLCFELIRVLEELNCSISTFGSKRWLIKTFYDKFQTLIDSLSQYSKFDNWQDFPKNINFCLSGNYDDTEVIVEFNNIFLKEEDILYRIDLIKDSIERERAWQKNKEKKMLDEVFILQEMLKTARSLNENKAIADSSYEE